MELSDRNSVEPTRERRIPQLVLKSVGKDNLLPQKKQELSDQVLLLLDNDQVWRNAKDIALAIGFNSEHIRHICKKLFLE